MQQALWLILALAVGDDPHVLDVGNGLKLSGTLDKASPRQVYHVKLHEGGTYVIDMVGPNPKALDPFLRLLDTSGKTLAADDDGGGGLNARIIFLATATGTYRIVASSVDSPGVGRFTVAVKRDDTRQADALEARVQFLDSAGETAEALAAARDLVKTRARLQGPMHPQTVDARWQVRNLEKIASLPASGKTELADAKKLNTRALQLHQKGKYAEATTLFEKALAMRRKILGEAHLDTAQSYSNLALNLKARGKYAEATLGHEKALAIYRNILGDEHPDTARGYNNLAGNLHAQGKYVEAAPLFEKALAIRRRILGAEHPLTAESYSNLALNLDARDKYTEAASFYEKALAICRKVLGEEHSYTATSYNNLAANLDAQGKYAEAAPFHEKALAIYRTVLGEEHLHTAGSYNNLAYNLNAQAKYAAAAPLFGKSLAIRRKFLGEEHPLTAGCYNNLAYNLKAQGKYAAAATLNEKALAIYRRMLGEEHPQTALSYNNLAENLHAQGADAAAAPLLEKALTIRRKKLGEEHRDTAESYNNLASSLNAQAKYAAAAPPYEKALAIWRNILGEEHPDTARGYNNLAFNHNAQGRYAEAEPLFQTALAIRRKSLGQQHPDTAESYSNLAYNLMPQGKYAEAAPLYQKALAIWRNILGEEHFRTVTGYQNLADNLYLQGKYAEAEHASASASRTYAIVRLRSARTGLGRAAFAAKGSPAAFLSACLARNGKPVLAWQNLESSLARGLLDEITSGFPRPVSPDESRREQDLLARLDQFDRKILALVSNRRMNAESANQRRSDPRKSAKSAFHLELEEVLEQRRQGGQELAKLEAAVAARQVYDLKRIQSRIPADAAFVAWVDIQGQPKAKDPNGEHWACVLRRSGLPAWLKLPGSGSGGAWTKGDDELPGRFRRAVAEPGATSTAELRGLKEKLSAQRLTPLAPHLAARDGLPAVTRLIAVPVGAMAGVPVEAFADRYVVSYIPSGSMWARLQEKGGLAILSTMLLAVGDPVFRVAERGVADSAPLPKNGILITKALPGLSAARSGLAGGDVLLQYGDLKLEGQVNLASAIKAQADKTAVEVTVWRAGKTFTVKMPPGPLGIQINTQPAEQVILAQRDGDRIIRASRGAGYKRLLGSRAEVEAIARLLPQEAILKLLGSEASEQRLTDLAASGELKKYRYLHFATHGDVNEHIAFQSAIILAHDKLPDPADALRGSSFIDGRLSASELLSWKLDADMVVLSACQTGLGQKAGGEGYLGFSQALFIAGARSLVVSLWKVDDTATSLLMVRFYENLLGRRPGLKAAMPKGEALAEAKRWLRNLTKKEAETLAKNLPAVERIGTASGRQRPRTASDRPYEHPYYWAAFILIGDPR